MFYYAGGFGCLCFSFVAANSTHVLEEFSGEVSGGEIHLWFFFETTIMTESSEQKKKEGTVLPPRVSYEGGPCGWISKRSMCGYMKYRYFVGIVESLH